MNSIFRRGHWLIAALCALVLVLAALFGRNPFADLFSPFGLTLALVVWTLPIIIWFAVLILNLAQRRMANPMQIIHRMARRNRVWLLRGIALTLMILPVGRAFSSLKISIPDYVAFYADPYFVAWDRMLFGTDPWRLTHALMGEFGTVFIDRFYILWFFVTIGTLAWLNFSRNYAFQIRGLMTYLLAWFLLGNVLAAAASSTGPIFYQAFYNDDHFAPLLASLHATDDLHSLKMFSARQYLVDNFGSDRAGAGISAMPSLHVGIAFLFFLMCRNGLTVRWPSWCAGFYALLVLIGSVHLGWHYAVDGIVSIIGVAAIWWAVGRVMDWAERRSAARAAALPEGALALPAI